MNKINDIIQCRGDGTFYCIPYADGGYPFIYLDKYDYIYCAACATTIYNQQIYGDNETSDSIVAWDIFYEGATEHCTQCNIEIESAYGDPEENSVLDYISDITRHNDCVSQCPQWAADHVNPYDKTNTLISDEETLRAILDYLAAGINFDYNDLYEKRETLFTKETIREAVTILAKHDSKNVS